MARKRAVLVGINNYQVSNFNLRGCLNDTDSLSDLLTSRYGFLPEDITILKDNKATKQGILSEIDNLFAGVGPGDVLVLGYSGHGVTHTVSGDQTIREAIVPYETTSTASLISNRDINSIARKAFSTNNLSGKANFTAIYDCCHSGLMFKDMMLDENGRFEIGIVNRVIDLSQLLPSFSTRDIELNDDFQVFSACRDNQTAADMARNPGKGISQPRGAFSFVLHNLMRQDPSISVGALEANLPKPIEALVAPHVQVPVFAVQESWKSKPIFTV